MAKKNDSFEPAPRKNFELCTIKEQASLAVDVLRKTINKMRVRTPEKNLFLAIKGSMNLNEFKQLADAPLDSPAFSHRYIYIKLGIDKIHLFAKDPQGKLYEQVHMMTEKAMPSQICELGKQIMAWVAESPQQKEILSYYKTSRYHLGVFLRNIIYQICFNKNCIIQKNIYTW